MFVELACAEWVRSLFPTVSEKINRTRYLVCADFRPGTNVALPFTAFDC